MKNPPVLFSIIQKKQTAKGRLGYPHSGFLPFVLEKEVKTRRLAF